MSDTRKDGGPAFPFGTPTYQHDAQQGMSRRQYYAGQIMARWIGQYDVTRVSSDRLGFCARMSWAAADALIAEEGK